LLLMLIGALLEMLGIGLVIPAVAVIGNFDGHAHGPAMAAALEMFGHPTREQLIVGVMVGFIAVNSVRVAFLAFPAWWLARVSWGFGADLSLRLYAGYLHWTLANQAANGKP
jgi:ATP-binding cassette, subfamily B, bacterial PglK